jgi:hypothetical protein
MKTLHITDEKVLETWNLCTEAYVRHGRKLEFPKHTIASKTYQWRYARSLAAKFDEWRFDQDTAKKFIDIALKHAKKSGTLHKGLAAFHQGNLLQICYDAVLREEQVGNQSLATLTAMKEWLDQQIQGQPIVLLSRRTPRAFCNLVQWYQASRISPLFLALSRVCGRAMAKLGELDPVERTALPSVTELYRIRSEFLSDKGMSKQARVIFGNDWREMCL